MDISKLMKQAKEMQEKMQSAQAELAISEYTGKSGGGIVTTVMLGNGKIKEVKIDASLLRPEDKEMVEDLMVTAFNDARNKIDSAAKDSTAGMFSGLGLPAGFKMPF